MATFTNQATLSYNNTVTTSNITTGEIVEVLSASKTAVVDTYAIGDSVTYVISLVNAGTAPFTGLTVTDSLGSYPLDTANVTPLDYVDGSLLYYVNGALQTTPAVTAGPPLVISGITVPAGGNATLVYQATVNRFAPPAAGGTITNEAVISGDSLSTPITVTETVGALSQPLLTISKSLSPTTVSENGQITYTFVIQNSGSREALATDDLTVSDTFAPILENIAVTLNGQPLSEGVQYTYDETTGEFVTIPGQITVPAATFTQDPVTGVWTTSPGVSVLTVTGTV
ncbi:MAG: hypothetical protein E7655_02790 [Ruminococcaceae bacterium]|nr:hypothetical protein [Oscillospiraceae bacterium]